MTICRDEAVAALASMLRGPLVADGFRLIDVRHQGPDVLVLFRWRENRHVFGVVIPWPEAISLTTGEPADSPEEWAAEASLRLAEELDTGYVGRALRRQKPDHIELFGRGYEFDGRYYISQVPGDGAWLAHCGWNVRVARRLRDRGLLIAWLQTYVNNASGEPVVGQAVVGRRPDGDAELAVLDVATDAPDVIARDLIWVAVHEAGDGGAVRIKIPGRHSRLMTAMGFQTVRDDDGAWADTSPLDMDP
ncbi:hypothetical protein [Ornithinimicrobium sp. LYQ103]|uniref:hypothetical protein n=1 Tax=Ornithinimicrobium sp. LYQ103 TaxID=3378796 RepID=UPI003852752E